MEQVKNLDSEQRKGLRGKVERMRRDIRIYRSSYYTPDYFRVLTVLDQKLSQRGYQTINREIEENLEQIENSFENNHFPRYPSSYIKKLRLLVMEAGREDDISRKKVRGLSDSVEEIADRVKRYEYQNVAIELSTSRITVSSLFTVGTNRNEWSIELISPKLEYGGRTFQKRRVLAYMAQEGRPLSRPEIEEGVGKKIPYFGCIVQAVVRQHLMIPIPGENKYELTGTGDRVGEVYIELIDEGHDQQ